jgi:hypothetical protein
MKTDISTYQPDQSEQIKPSFSPEHILKVDRKIDISTLSQKKIDKLYSLKDEDITEFGMAVSEKNLSETWDDEDDAYWESFL